MTRHGVKCLGLSLLLRGCAVAPLRVLTDEACQPESRSAVLIPNPAAPPAWVWVAEDEIPTTGQTILYGKRIAPPDVVAAWSPPPCGIPVSRVHRVDSEEETSAWTVLGVVGAILQAVGRGLR